MRYFMIYVNKLYQKEEYESISNINICQITNNIINCAQESVSLLTKGGAVMIKMQICFNIKVRGTKRIQSILKLMLELVLTQMI